MKSLLATAFALSLLLAPLVEHRPGMEEPSGEPLGGVDDVHGPEPLGAPSEDDGGADPLQGR